jgi:hypothetical protein
LSGAPVLPRQLTSWIILICPWHDLLHHLLLLRLLLLLLQV